ncbi:mitochondrial protein Fmp25 [Cordyceps fumosorosea ARSEF 2679]|uniref:Mitochondrial protein Fmp25 n=1 Tax=Cordyceps fumosorosea (strain ARSEF 2679) TaxID=1081104 RepID=A0A162J2N2_CORFA|nr:mitochondrial protein Fmp25 [Cordyceps fumosorosea ARSEF 2679]OAA62922.1 mitochondrial protein Fmp25 [Cordyceps fumosorosea ARSEF 2679]
MNCPTRVLTRSAQALRAAAHHHQRALYSNVRFTGPPRRRGGKLIGFAAVFGTAAAGAYYYPRFVAERDSEEKVRPKAELEFEQARPTAASAEEYRDLLSSQHVQIKRSLEHPGVYAWGSNAGKVIDPESNEKYIKLPRRIAYFNDLLLRDLKLTSEFGAAVTEDGDLVQWGAGFSQTDPKPSVTLRGKDLAKIEVSADRIIALSRGGNVYSVPASRNDVEGGVKLDERKSGWSLWSPSGKAAVNFRDLTPPGLGWGEHVTDVKSGLEHALILTSKGRVFAVASSASSYPSKGQMGIPGLSWDTRPAGAYDQPQEINELSGFRIAQIAAGDYHSVVLDKAGRIFAWGDNAFGQLGFDSEGVPVNHVPNMVATNQLYAKSGLVANVTSIAAGGVNTFFTVDAKPPSTKQFGNATPSKAMPRATSDLWAAGQGTYGTLGTGRWTHVSTAPTKVKGLSGLYEFDEGRNEMRPIKVKGLEIGTTHCSAVMDNVTSSNAASKKSANETDWGSDVLFWGGNEHYQLGTGKRTNMNSPVYIGPLEAGDADAQTGRKGEVHRMCLTPKQTARLGVDGKGRKATLEQRVVCGRYVSGVYSAV